MKELPQQAIKLVANSQKLVGCRVTCYRTEIVRKDIKVLLQSSSFAGRHIEKVVRHIEIAVFQNLGQKVFDESRPFRVIGTVMSRSQERFFALLQIRID